VSDLEYTGYRNDIVQNITKDAYISAIHDVAVRQRLLELNPWNIVEAHNQALRLMAIFQSEIEKQNVRVLKTDDDSYEKKFNA
jgi:hypothetical protein